VIKLFTIGFAGKSAERFFQLLHDNGVGKIVDTRLNPSSQLSGFAKGADLAYFARQLGGIRYEDHPEFAPTAEMLSSYREKEIDWQEYERLYLALLDQRKIINSIDLNYYHLNCFLCSEHSPARCHRRLLVEYLASDREDTEVVHLM
jgi:uncharacterized protein (DUF488 family)